MFATISFTISDADGDKFPVSVRVSIPDATTLADVIDLYVSPFYFNGIGGLTLGYPDSARVIIEPDMFAYQEGFIVTADVDVQEQARFKFQTATGFDVVITIPAMWEDLFTGTGAGKEIDITNAQVLTFIALMTEDIGSGGIDAVDSHGHDISRFISGKEHWGK
jgi:hypothetical protein